MNMNSFRRFENFTTPVGKDVKVIVPCPYDASIIRSLEAGVKKGLWDCLLVGDGGKISQALHSAEVAPSSFKILETQNEAESLERATSQLLENTGNILMKGLVHTGHFLKSILKHKCLLASPLLTHLAVYELPDRLLFMTDGSIVVNPDLLQMKQIAMNAIQSMRRLGVEEIRVALISSIETPTTTIPSSIAASSIMTSLQEEFAGQGIEIEGPLAVDNAWSPKAAQLKASKGNVAGKANLFVMPSMDAGNIFGKCLTYIACIPCAGLLSGLSVPVVLTSRSADENERYNSLIIARKMLFSK